MCKTRAVLSCHRHYSRGTAVGRQAARCASRGPGATQSCDLLPVAHGRIRLRKPIFGAIQTGACHDPRQSRGRILSAPIALINRRPWGRPPPDVPLRVVAFQRNPPNRRNAAPIHELPAPLKTRVELRCTLMGMCRLRSLARPAAKKDA